MHLIYGIIQIMKSSKLDAQTFIYSLVAIQDYSLRLGELLGGFCELCFKFIENILVDKCISVLFREVDKILVAFLEFVNLGLHGCTWNFKLRNFLCFLALFLLIKLLLFHFHDLWLNLAVELDFPRLFRDLGLKAFVGNQFVKLRNSVKWLGVDNKEFIGQLRFVELLEGVAFEEFVIELWAFTLTSTTIAFSRWDLEINSI